MRAPPPMTFPDTLLQADTLTQAARAGFVLWVATEVPVFWRQRSRKTGAKTQDRGSLPLVLLPLALGVGLALLGPAVLGGPMLPTWLRVAGCALAVAGLLLRQWSVRVLGRFFTVDVSVHREHRLIEDGPYRWLRHPSYTGFGLILTGLGLGLGSPWGVLAMLGPALPGFFWRVNVEEQALLTAFGDRYAGYRQRTWRVIPGIY